MTRYSHTPIPLLRWGVMLVGIWGMIALAPGQSVAAPPTPAQVARARADLRTYYAWINAPWTEDDQPYQRIRDSVDRALADGQKPTDLLKQYQAALVKAPGNYRAQFGYYYAAYKGATAAGASNSNIGLQILGNLFINLIRRQYPHTYNYARLAFLCGQYNWIDPELKAVGLRLVRRDPSDYDVKFYTVSTLGGSPVPADHDLAVAYAQDLIRRYPRKPSVYGLLAFVHYQAWLREKDPKEAAQAIAGYQQYLQLAPPDFKFREQAKRYIAQLQRG